MPSIRCFRSTTRYSPNRDHLPRHSTITGSAPAVRAATNQLDMSDQEKLWADWLLFLGAMMCPTDLTFVAKECASIPGLWKSCRVPAQQDQAPGAPDQIQINAFNIDKHKITHFSNRPRRGQRPNITAHHLRAALSFPFIYSPYTIGGERFYEARISNPKLHR